MTANPHPRHLLLRGGHVIDPSQGIDGPADVLFSEGRVAALGPALAAPADAEVRDVSGSIVMPGLIDLHTHVYWGGTSIGVDAVELARTSATATFVDAGTAGPGNFPGFRKHVIEPALPVRILPLLNLSFAGIFAFSDTVMIGECEDLRLLDLKECVRVAREHADLMVGIKVRVGRNASGASGIAPLDMALEVAEATGLPLMAHLDHPPPSRLDVTSRLRRGDILTHCFRPFPNAPSHPGGGVRPEILAARERGVIFDIGHGAGSCGFDTSRAMLAAGFLPDVISSDVHVLSINGPAFDLLQTLAKFHALGMTLPQVVACATHQAARAIRRPDLGTLRPGSVGEASLFDVLEQPTEYQDVVGQVITGTHRFKARGLVLDGRWWHGH
ncbi:MAG: amidohydrolase/deacetylase family metallohydrolase [Rhodoferax sp.]|nr:amidohydrolase/deacetylase family metallohydrolase [Rhodoferax sp.]